MRDQSKFDDFMDILYANFDNKKCEIARENTETKGSAPNTQWTVQLYFLKKDEAEADMEFKWYNENTELNATKIIHMDPGIIAIQ